MRCLNVKVRSADGVVIDESVHLVFVRDETGVWEQVRVRELGRREGPFEVAVVPRRAVRELALVGVDRCEHVGGFHTVVDPQRRGARDAAAVDVDELYVQGRYGELAAALRVDGGGSGEAHLSALAERFPEAVCELVSVAGIEEIEELARRAPPELVGRLVSQVGRGGGVADRGVVDAMVRGCDPATLTEVLARSGGSVGGEYLLGHPGVVPSAQWSDRALGWGIANPNLDAELAARARRYWEGSEVMLDEGMQVVGAVAGSRRDAVADVVGRARMVGYGLAGAAHSDEAAAEVLGRLCEPGAVALVERRRLCGEVAEAALGNGYPAVRRALARRCLAEVGSGGEASAVAHSALLRLADDHDVVVRSVLAERCEDPLVLAALARSPERQVRERLAARGVELGGRPGAGGDAATPAWPGDAGVAMWREVAWRPAYGEAVDGRWEGRAVAARMRLDADAEVWSQVRGAVQLDEVTAALRQVPEERRGAAWQAARQAADEDPRHQLLASRELQGMEDGELADFAAAMAMLWQESGNVGTGRDANEWLGEVIAVELGVQGRYRRGVGDAELDERRPVVDALWEQAGAAGRTFVRAAYDEAQDRFASAGVAHVPVSRGMTLTRDEAARWGLTVFEPEDMETGRAGFVPSETGLPQSTVSSWGYGASGAGWRSRGPSHGGVADGDLVHVVIRAMVPVEQVAGFGAAGFSGSVLRDGSLPWSEGEVLVLDADRPCEILAVAGESCAQLAQELMGEL